MGERTRRGRGEGTIFKRKDGLWCAAITSGYADTGARRRRYAYGSTKHEVQEKLTRMHNDSLNGTLVGACGLKLAAFFNDWLENVVRPNNRATTHKLYSILVKRHINPWLGGITLYKLTPAQVQALYSTLERNGKSARLRQMVHARLHKALGYAVKRGLVSRNVCDAVEPPTSRSKPMRVLDASQVKQLLEHAKNDRLYALYLLAVTTGLRQGELFALHWADVDLDRRALSVRHSLMEICGQLQLVEPKTENAKRRIELTSQASEALRDHRKRMIKEGNAGHWVFCDTDGGPLRKSNLIRRSFRPLLRGAGLPYIRFHDLRHTVATLLLSQGTHPKIVQELLGHAKIGLTLDLYSHSVPTLHREAVDKLEVLLGRTATPG